MMQQAPCASSASSAERCSLHDVFCTLEDNLFKQEVVIFTVSGRSFITTDEVVEQRGGKWRFDALIGCRGLAVITREMMSSSSWAAGPSV